MNIPTCETCGQEIKSETLVKVFEAIRDDAVITGSQLLKKSLGLGLRESLDLYQQLKEMYHNR